MPMRGEDYWMVAGANISYLAVALRINKKSSCLTDFELQHIYRATAYPSLFSFCSLFAVDVALTIRVAL
jgi:hypothetical protein